MISCHKTCSPNNKFTFLLLAAVVASQEEAGRHDSEHGGQAGYGTNLVIKDTDFNSKYYL